MHAKPRQIKDDLVWVKHILNSQNKTNYNNNKMSYIIIESLHIFSFIQSPTQQYAASFNQHNTDSSSSYQMTIFYVDE